MTSSQPYQPNGTGSGPGRTTRTARAGSRSLRLMTVLGGALIAAMLALTGIELYREFSSAERLREAVRQSYETRSSIQSVFSLLQDAETGQRGYVITGDPRFLRPYEAARETLDGRLSELGRRFVDDPEQAVDHVVLLQLTQRKRRTMEQGIDTRSRLGSQAAIALVSAGA